MDFIENYVAPVRHSLPEKPQRNAALERLIVSLATPYKVGALKNASFSEWAGPHFAFRIAHGRRSLHHYDSESSRGRCLGVGFSGDGWFDHW